MDTRSPHFRRILVIRFHMIGDVLLLTPLLSNLRRRFPDSHLELLTDGPAAALLDGHPALNKLTIYNRESGRQRFTPNDLSKHLAILRYIRSQKYDLVINLQPGCRGELATRWSGAECRVGFDRKGLRSATYTNRIAEWSERYRADHLLDAIRVLGMDAEIEPPSIGLTEFDREYARLYTIPNGRPLVVMHAGRPDTIKCWPDERFAAVADVLTSECGAHVVFIGDKTDGDRVNRIMQFTRNTCDSLAGVLNLKQSGALLAEADLFVGIDSCPMHIASAVGTPTLSLFGPSDPRIWNPIGADHVAIRRTPIDEHCGKPHCEPGPTPCMLNISVEDVRMAATDMIRRKRYGSGKSRRQSQGQLYREV